MIKHWFLNVDVRVSLQDKSVFVRSLRLALPGLDVNDPAKTTMTLNFFVALLPLVDPAEAAELEDIMEDFFQRVLSVIGKREVKGFAVAMVVVVVVVV